MIRIIIQQDWWLIRQSSLFKILGLVFAGCLAIAALNGRSTYQGKLTTHAAIDTTAAYFPKKLSSRLQQIEANNGQFNGSPFVDPRSPYAVGNSFAPRFLVYPLEPLAQWSIGQSDIYPTYYRVTAAKRQSLILNEEIANPQIQFTGYFDVAFVLVYLLPLLIVGFTYNLSAQEYELGTLRMLLSEPVSFQRIVAVKFLFRLTLASIIIWLALWILALLTGIPTDVRWLQFTTGAWLYSILWFSLSWMANAVSRKRSGTTASMLIGAWLFFILLVPGIISQVANSRYPMPSRIDLITATREAAAGVSMKSSAVLGKYLQDHPELVKDTVKVDPNDFAIKYFTSLIETEKVIAPLEERFEVQLIRQQVVAGQLSYFSPALMLQSFFNATAGTGEDDLQAFKQHAGRFYELNREFFTRKIVGQEGFTSAGVGEIPAPEVYRLGRPVVGTYFMYLLVLVVGFVGVGGLVWGNMRTVLGVLIIPMLSCSFVLTGYAQTTKPGIDTLKQVIISAQRSKVTISGNKVTLNVGNSATTAGGSVLDLLKNLPGVSIDQDENVLFRGSSQLNIMIDGKMTYVSGKELAQMLKGISAENIAKIEMLLSPSAEFDAAGNAGMLNIVSKKNLRAGYAADLRTAVSKGKYWMTNENISASFRGRQFSISGSFDYNTPHKFIKGSSSNMISENGAMVRIQRDNEVSFKINYYTYRLGADWQIAPRHQLLAGYSGYKDDFTAPKWSAIGKYDQAQHPVSTLYTTVNIIEPYYYDAGNIGYRFDIDPVGKNITADAHFISYRNYSDSWMESIYHDPEGMQTGDRQVLRSTQPGFIKIRSFKLDTELPFSSITIKAGLKYSKVTNDNRYRFDSLVAGHFAEAPSLSDHFMYAEEIKAAYISGSKKIGRIGLNIGLRLEDTDARGYTVKQSVDNNWNYTRLFPSGSVDYEINDQNKFNFSVSRRIERPRYANLNPVRWYNDPYFMFAGNVDLKPEMGWLFTSTYTFQEKYVLMLSYSKRSDFLSRRLMVERGTNAVISQMANFDRLQRFDMSLTAPFTPLPGWQVQCNAGLNYMTYPISQLHGNRTLSQWAGNLQLLQQIALPLDIKMECNTYWYSSELMGVYKHSSFFYVDWGIKRSFMKNALDARLSVNDVFSTNHFKAVSQTNYTDYTYHNRPDTRRIGLSLTYHFGGKLSTGKTRRIEEQDRL